jgi:hypothetical protein
VLPQREVEVHGAVVNVRPLPTVQIRRGNVCDGDQSAFRGNVRILALEAVLHL